MRLYEMLMRDKAIILIGMSHSSHFIKWVSKLIPSGANIYFIESTKSKVNSVNLEESGKEINDISHNFDIHTWFKLKSIFNYKTKLLSLFTDEKLDIIYFVLKIRKIVKSHKEIIIHAFEFQNAGYLLLKIHQYLDQDSISKIKVVCTNFGSDIFWFKNNENDLEKIKSLLRITQIYICESERDVILAKELGYQKVSILTKSNSLGIPDRFFHRFEISPKIDRNIIYVKGNFGFVGRPFPAIDILCSLNKEIKKRNLKVVVTSLPSENLQMVTNQLNNFEIENQVVEQGRLSQTEIYSLLSKSLVYLGFSLSDGLSTTCIESMAFGAIPFQTSSSTIFEYCSEMICHEVDLLNLHSTREKLRDILISPEDNYESMIRNRKFIQVNFLESKILSELAKYKIYGI